MRTLYLLLLILWSINVSSQSCFEAYDLMFENGADTLSYSAFHAREVKFLEDLNGCKSPEFSVQTLEGDELILSAMQGKVVVLNFWFTTCMPCLKEIPEFNLLTEKFDSDDVVFIAMARDEPEKLKVFFKRFGEYKFQIVPESYRIATEYKVVGWPQTMVIDRRGMIHQSWVGRHESVKVLAGEIEYSIMDCLQQ